MTEAPLTAEQHAETPEEKIWVVNSLLKRQLALSHEKPAAEITHDVQLALIGTKGEFIKISRLDEMTKLFADMKISNIHIRHITGSVPEEHEAGPYAFMLSDLLALFASELNEYDNIEKVRQSQSFGMFLVFMVKDSFMENFGGGVKLASWFLGILSALPGLETVRSALIDPPVVSMLSSADVARHLFSYVSGQTMDIPEDEIAFLLMKKDDSVLSGIDEAITYFTEYTDGNGGVGVSCHFVPYVSSETLPEEMIRLSDLFVTVATLAPEPGGLWDEVADNLMGLLYHVCNSNLKGVASVTPTELEKQVMVCKRYMAEQAGRI